MGEPQPQDITFKTGWWYQEFYTDSPTKGVPGVGVGAIGNSQQGGVDGGPSAITKAQTWLSGLSPGTPVFGMIDTNGDVRLFWYGQAAIGQISPIPIKGIGAL